ncbi:MAG TPA: hypothetical protein VG105_05275 [Paraburkholderia sp.]|jgi:hypothetical protein|nr:hypothetical protein [Paraburkholderia sp.]
MKLSAYIALLEAIRDSEDEDLDVFVGHSDGKPDRGLKDAKEPATPEVVTLLKETRGRDVRR